MDHNHQSLGRGVIEGFFGRQWTWKNRRTYASFLKEHGYRYYIYAPKGDRFIRNDWAESWTSDTFEEMQNLGETYRGSGLAWGIGLNLYELHFHYDEKAIRLLEEKIRYLNKLQPDILAILFDDMKGDVDRIAEIQVDVTHRAHELTTARSVIMCPTYYSDDPMLDRLFGERPKYYLEDLGNRLDPSVHVFWTGPEVCSTSYPVEHLESVGERLGRKPFIWDNYPVNDSEKMSPFLHLRAFENRPFQMEELTSGHAINPMNQACLSQIPMMTLNLSYEEKEAYDPERALEMAIHTLCGDSMAPSLLEDLSLFQDRGLDQLSKDQKENLIRKYAQFENNFSEEIVGWLRGEYPWAPECLTE